MTTTHQKILLDVSQAIGKLVEYYVKTEQMPQDDAIRFAFRRITELEEMLLAEGKD